MAPRLGVTLLLTVLLLIPGCTGTAPGDTAMPASSTTTKTTTTSAASTTTTTPTCTAERPKYDVDAPEKPSSMDERTVLGLVKGFEKRYKRARIYALYENVSISQTYWVNTSVRDIDGGYEVRVKLSVSYSTDRRTASGGYETVYRVTETRFVRNGRTLACWANTSTDS